MNLNQNSDRLLIIAKEFLKLPSLHMVIKSPVSWDFWQIAIVFLAKGMMMKMMMMMMMNCFVVWLTEERRLALFPAGIIVRDPHHRESRHAASSSYNYYTKLNVLYPLNSTVLRFFLQHLIERNYLLKIFQRTLILMT